MTISYCITVCDEQIEIQSLIYFLIGRKRDQDEIVVLVDLNKTTPEILDYLQELSISNKITLIKDYFNRDFSDWKNKLTKWCKGDYLFNIDADEIPHENLVDSLPYIIEENPNCDIFLVPRINIVEGITTGHIAKWGWNVTDNGWINFPDNQSRIYRNTPEIKWVNKVHEKLDGFKVWSVLPPIEEFSLYHPKTIDKQEKQNQFYNEI